MSNNLKMIQFSPCFIIITLMINAQATLSSSCAKFSFWMNESTNTFAHVYYITFQIKSKEAFQTAVIFLVLQCSLFINVVMQQGFLCLPNPPMDDLHRAFVDKQDTGNKRRTQNARGTGQPVQPATGAAMFVCCHATSLSPSNIQHFSFSFAVSVHTAFSLAGLRDRQ